MSKKSALRPTSMGTAAAEKNAEQADTESTHSKLSGNDPSLFSYVGTYCTFNAKSKRFRQMYILQMLILPFVPITALIAQNVHTMVTFVKQQESMNVLRSTINEATNVGRVVSALQVERSEVAFFIFTNGSVARNISGDFSPIHNLEYRRGNRIVSQRERLGDLERVFDATDVTLSSISNWNDISTVGNSGANIAFNSKLRFKIRLEDLRETINKSMTEMHSQIEWYSSANEVFLEVLNGRVTATKLSSDAIRSLLTYVNIIRSIEHFGVLMAYGLRFFNLGELQGDFLLRAIRSDTLFWEYINNTRSYSREMLDKIHVFFDSYEEMSTIIEVRNQMLNEYEEETELTTDATDFYLAGVSLIDRLRELQQNLRNIIEENATAQLASAYYQQLISIVVMIIVLLLSPVIITIVHRTARQMEEFADSLTKKTVEAKREKRKADTLLAQLLPAHVVQQLKVSGKVPAESFEAVTIYFSDIVGFTNIASLSTPIQVVTFLNTLYKLFDSRIDRYDIYKVETIGDAYMCVSGLPKRNGDRHATEIADMALDLLMGISKFEIPHIRGRNVEIRIGVHTGSCVAGVVGTKMPRYCLFGDTINVASCLESTGKPQMIHISDKTHTYLAKAGRYNMEFKGQTDIKGRGLISTYWLREKVGGLPKYVELSGEIDARPEFITQEFLNEDSQPRNKVLLPIKHNK